ncbi:MAG: class I SAM-dependent methyltransferase [Janthinobacterium lividum]
MDSLTLVSETFTPLEGRRLLDVGCGAGLLAAALLVRGAAVTGVDVSLAALATARQRAPQACFREARAEALPFATGSFDGAILLNALHHVPVDRMRTALAEAIRVVGPRGSVLVIEPTTDGSFFEAFRCIEDETEIRDLAQAAVGSMVRDGEARLLRETTFVRTEVVAGFAAFRSRVVSVDPAREAAAQAMEATFERDFLHHAVPQPGGGFLLEQPLRAQVLAGPAP